MRLNRLPHGFTPASPRCLCAMDKESLGKGLQDCLRALGTGQGADPPAAPAPQAAAAPPAPHLADKFPLKEEVVVHNTCNPDTTLAPETPEWRLLANVTPKYVFRRAMMLWMRKHRQEDKDGVQSYPWETKCLSAGEHKEDSTSFSNPHAAEEALKERRAQKQEAIDEEGKKTMEDSPSYNPLEEKEVTPAPEAEAEKDSDNGVPVPTPPVIPEPKDTEKHIPVPSPPEVPEPKESEEQVVKEEKVESAGPGVQEHQERFVVEQQNRAEIRTCSGA